MNPEQTLDHTELRNWLRLSRTTGVGPVTFYNLIARFGSAQNALAEIPRLARRGGRIKALNIPDIEQIDAELEALDQISGRMLPACDPDFPYLLSRIDPPPPVISVIGQISCLQKPAIAMVGSRNASAIGMRFAKDMAHDLGKAGMIVVSGLARGIDGAAHSGALSTGTIAVVAGGVDHIYPHQHAQLRQMILKDGAIISERRLGHKATARDFPRRNRIISGLGFGTIVIEAAKRSGSLITARYALEQNREVFAAPGSPLDPRAGGGNALIKQGATLIENAEDVIKAFQQTPQSHFTEDPPQYESQDIEYDEQQIDAAREKILQLLSPTPICRDELVRASGYPVAICSSALVELELAGLANCQPGGMISKAGF